MLSNLVSGTYLSCYITQHYCIVSSTLLEHMRQQVVCCKKIYGTCNEGYVGDGKTCTSTAVPATSPSGNSPVGTTPSSKTSGSGKILVDVHLYVDRGRVA
jgi:hypothetical protein